MVSASAGHRAIGPDIPELSPETSDIPRGQVEGCVGSVEAGQGQSLCLLSCAGRGQESSRGPKPLVPLCLGHWRALESESGKWSEKRAQ